MDIEQLLSYMVKRNASDMFITAEVSPAIKVNGKMEFLSKTALNAEQVKRMVFSAMPPRAREEFDQLQEANFALNLNEIGRFRVNVFQQQNNVGMVVRRINTRIPTIDELGLPQTMKMLAMARRGLIFFVGATGAGKSTSLASLIGFRNQNGSGHIVTIEEPIEFVHRHQGCIITQREIGIDTQSYTNALKNALRQAPDVILIGEIRTRETMEHAMAFAETGHLCFATLHANNANQTMERVLNFFPEDRHPQVLMDLSMNLRAIAAQRLIPTPDGRGRRVAVELLINTPRVADLIRNGDFHMLKEAMARYNSQGMRTFDQAVYELYCNGQISYEDAISHADSENEVRLMIKLGKNQDPSHIADNMSGVQLADYDEYGEVDD